MKVLRQLFGTGATLLAAVGFQLIAATASAGQVVNATKTLQDVLNPQFVALGTACLPGKAFQRVRPTRMPSEVADSAERMQQVTQVEGNDLVPLLRFVYMQKSLDDWQRNKTAQSRFLPFAAEDYRPNPHFNNTLYVGSCMSMLNAALHGNVGGKLPVAEVRTAVDAEFNQQQRSDLVLMRGRFESPVYHALHDVGGAAALEAYLSVWRYYVDHNAVVNGMYLSNLTGWLVTQVSHFSRSAQGKVDASAGGAWLVGGFNTTLGAQSGSDTQVFGNRFQVLALMQDSTNAAAGWEALPTTTEIRNHLNAAVQYQPHPNTAFRYVGSGVAQRHLQTITGIPNTPANPMCSTAKWVQTVSLTDPAQGSIRLVSVAPDASAPTTCVFEMEFSPSQSAVTGAKANSLTLNYTVEAKEHADTAKLWFNASADVETSDEPKVLPPTAAVAAQVIPSSREVQFAVPFAIAATRVPIKNGPGEFPAAAPNNVQVGSLSCGSWQKADVRVTLLSTGGGQYSAEGKFQLDQDQTKWPTDTSRCTFSTDLSLPLRIGSSVTRKLEAVVSFDLSSLRSQSH